MRGLSRPKATEKIEPPEGENDGAPPKDRDASVPQSCEMNSQASGGTKASRPSSPGDPSLTLDGV